MRSVMAIAKYRYLVLMRSPAAIVIWLATLLLLLIALPGASEAFATRGFSNRSGTDIWLSGVMAYGTVDWEWPDVVQARASGLLILLSIHALALACCVATFATAGVRFEDSGTDPLELTPIEAHVIFFGNALGLAMIALTMHFTILPVITVFECLSPLTGVEFAAIEVVLIACIAFASIAGAWAMHGASTAVAVARLLRAAVTIPLLAGFTAAITVRSWKASIDSILEFVRTPRETLALAVWHANAQSVPWLTFLSFSVAAYLCWPAFGRKFIFRRRATDAMPTM